jgi:hypothetical protein
MSNPQPKLVATGSVAFAMDFSRARGDSRLDIK